MANVFQKEKQNRSTIDIVRDTLDVGSNGSVTFRCRVGRGSGKAVEIPADQFDDFVVLMQEAKQRRAELAAQQQTNTVIASDNSVTKASE